VTESAPVAGRPALDWSGLLPIDKPQGMTSHDVVERVRRRLKAPHAGHLGTLDPGATGLLLVAIGTASRTCSAVTCTSRRSSTSPRVASTRPVPGRSPCWR